MAGAERRGRCACNRRGLGRSPNPDGVADRTPDPDGDREREEHQTERRAREQRQLRELLRDPHLERVHGTERRADGGSAQAHRRGCERVEADAASEDEEHGDQRDDLLLHVLERAGGRECHADHGDDERFAPLELPGEPIDPVPQGAGLVHDGERTAGEEHEEDDRPRVREAPRDRDERLEQADGRAGHRVISAGDHDLPARGRVLHALVFAGGEDVGQRGRDEDAGDEQRQRMGKPEARHAESVPGESQTYPWKRASKLAARRCP